MSEMKTLKFPGDAEPREIVDAKAREDISKLSDEIANIPSGVGMDITGATVGQIAKITAVDASGVPTAWSPVDMPSGGSVPKPLTYDYMPEGYPKKSVGTVTLLEEQELAFTLSNGRYMSHLTNAFEIVGGQTYKVSWDGTEYECVGFALEDSVTESIPAIGNVSITGFGDDTGEPFLYIVGDFETLDTSASHTISVETVEKTVTPMIEEFLPATSLITYDSNTDTYSSDLTYYELYARLLDGKQIVLHKTVENEYLYLTKWKKASSGRERIGLSFAGDNYSVLLNDNGTIVNIPPEEN